MTELEIMATITGIISVALQAKEKVIAWPFAIVSVSILAYIFLFEKLYSDLGLHVIYIVLNIYGWILWSQKKDTESVTPTKLLSRNGMLYSFITTIIGCGLLGYMMSTYTDADLPFFDSFTTSGSLVAQYLLAKKIFAKLVAMDHSRFGRHTTIHLQKPIYNCRIIYRVPNNLCLGIY